MKTKTTITAFVAGIAITSLFSFKMIYDAKKNTAEVESTSGLYIFIHSKPVVEYEVLGTYNPKVVWSADAKPIIEFMIKKGKESYPNADAIIFTNEDLSRADLVKLK